MNPKLEETLYLEFITASPTTGAATNADSTPTCEVFEETTDTAIITPTVVQRTGKVGDYRVPVACTAANGFEAAKSYAVVISATVGTVNAKAVIGNFQVRTRSVDDVLPTSSYSAPDNTNIALIPAIPTANQNADALIGRNVAGGSSAGRKVKDALAFLRNKWTLSGATLTVYDTDDTSVLWTATVSSDATAAPVTGSDPA